MFQDIPVRNPQDPKVAVVLLADTSGSMEGESINQLNEGIKYFINDVVSDNLASKRVEVALISFNDDAQIVCNFDTVTYLSPPTLEAQGYTAMGKALELAMEMVERRKQVYKQEGVDYFRPWIFLITDGAPTDVQPGTPQWNNLVDKINNAEKAGKFLFFAVGVEGANFALLKELSKSRPPLKLKPGAFREMFSWLSKSVQNVSSSRPGDQIKLPDPTWGTIPV